MMNRQQVIDELLLKSSRDIADIYRDYLIYEANVNDLEFDEEFINWLEENQEDYL